MIRITNSRHVPIWWSLNPPSERIVQLFSAPRSSNTQNSTSGPGDLRFDPLDNRGTPSDEEWPSSHEEPNSDGHQPEKSTAAAKRPPHEGPPGVVIPHKRLCEHTASIGWTLANQSHGQRSLLIGAGFGKWGDPGP